MLQESHEQISEYRAVTAMERLVSPMIKTAFHAAGLCLRGDPHGFWVYGAGRIEIIERRDYTPEYTVGSGIAASAKPFLRKRQLSQRPHAFPAGSGS